MSRPIAAVSGAETAAIVSVVKNEFQAAPLQIRPCALGADREGIDVVAQREAVVAAPGLDEAAEHDHQVDDGGERRPGQRRGVARAP